MKNLLAIGTSLSAATFAVASSALVHPGHVAPFEGHAHWLESAGPILFAAAVVALTVLAIRSR